MKRSHLYITGTVVLVGILIAFTMSRNNTSVENPLVDGQQEVTYPPECPSIAAEENELSEFVRSLGDGEFGFIVDVEEKGGEYSLSFDEANFLSQIEGTCTTPTGEEPWDGINPETGLPVCNPNGYYIDNPATTTRSIELAAENEIVVYTTMCGPMLPVRMSVQEFQKNIEDLIQERYLFGLGLPVWIEVEGGKTTKIAEQYLP